MATGEEERFDRCWSEEADQDPNDPTRIRSHRQGAAEIARAALSLGLYGSFNRVFYRPNGEVYARPEDATNGCDEVTFRSGDGTELHGWLLRARAGRAPRATVVHYHGCCNNLTHDLPFIDWLTEEGFAVLTFDYRGYGRSAGKPSRRGIFLDSVAALDLAREMAVAEELLVFGQSLGGAIALAAVGEGNRTAVRGVAVEGTFHSYRAVVNSKMSNTRLTYPLASLIVSDEHSPRRTVGGLAPVPLLILHGDRDRVISVEHGRTLSSLASDPKRYIEIAGGEHLDTFLAHDGRYRAELARFFASCLSSDQP